MDPPSKSIRSRKQGKAVKKPSISEDFWTTSTFDMDNSAFQSQGSLSSISVINQAPDPHGSGNPAEFVNHGNFHFSYFLVALLTLCSVTFIWLSVKYREKNKR